MADTDQAFGEGSQIGGCQKGLHLLKYQRLSATIVGYHINLFLLVELCDFSGNNHSLKVHYIRGFLRKI